MIVAVLILKVQRVVFPIANALRELKIYFFWTKLVAAIGLTLRRTLVLLALNAAFQPYPRSLSCEREARHLFSYELPHRNNVLLLSYPLRQCCYCYNCTSVRRNGSLIDN